MKREEIEKKLDVLETSIGKIKLSKNIHILIAGGYTLSCAATTILAANNKIPIELSIANFHICLVGVTLYNFSARKKEKKLKYLKEEQQFLEEEKVKQKIF